MQSAVYRCYSALSAEAPSQLSTASWRPARAGMARTAVTALVLQPAPKRLVAGVLAERLPHQAAQGAGDHMQRETGHAPEGVPTQVMHQSRR